MQIIKSFSRVIIKQFMAQAAAALGALASQPEVTGALVKTAGKTGMTLFIVIGAILALIVIVIFVLILTKKKKKANKKGGNSKGGKSSKGKSSKGTK